MGMLNRNFEVLLDLTSLRFSSEEYSQNIMISTSAEVLPRPGNNSQLMLTGWSIRFVGGLGTNVRNGVSLLFLVRLASI